MTMTDTNNVERIRFERLELVCRKALEHSIKKSLSLDQIKACYPTISSSEDGTRALEVARSQMISFWRSSSLKEFELIFKERDIEAKLNELDEVIQMAHQRKSAGVEVPTNIEKYSAKEIIDSTVLDSSESTIENLTMIYNQLCEDNREFYAELKDLTAKSETVKDEVNESLATLDKEVATVSQGNPAAKIEALLSDFDSV
ncbi:uncharacterized protein RJT21DRAFT_121108 [Scheffersomyces amazonensis]|uniref:uncharacterized protein n=1 Tax=Scheffersomyces amazonensis TaxID=1078765 RepID=UPI00315D9F87